MHEAVPLKLIRPNPFRNIDHYPIRRDKVDSLKESFNRTGYWGNIVARKVDDHYEIAYGHHRLIALNETLKPGDMVGLIVRELPDETMLQMMARENMQEWGTSADVEHETIRAVVLAYAVGKIGLGELDTKTCKDRIRHAPHFGLGDDRKTSSDHPYTTGQIAFFVGWSPKKTQTVLDRLAALEEHPEEAEDLGGLSTEQATAVVRLARKAKDPKQRKQVVKKITKGFKQPDKKRLSIREATEAAEEITGSAKPDKALRDINHYAEQSLVTPISAFLGRRDPKRQGLEEVAKHKDALLANVRKRLIHELTSLAERAVDFAGSLELENTDGA